MSKFVEQSKQLMQRQTKKNGAPAWRLTEMAVAKGEELAKKYKVDSELVVTALYLAHTIFSKIVQDDIQKNHEELSAKFAEKYLKKWKVPAAKREIILNAIRAHHNKVNAESKIAEVMKNAECFKFIQVEGALIHLHHLGTRGIPFEKAARIVEAKAKQKFDYISLKEIKGEAKKSYNEVVKLLKNL